MAFTPLGYIYNPVPTAAGVLISLKDAAGIAFRCIGADTYTLSSAATYNGSPTTLATITEYWTITSAAGAAQWVVATQAAADSITLGSGNAFFYVDAADLPAAAQYVKVAVGGSGLVQADLVFMAAQRDPTLLRVVSGASS